MRTPQGIARHDAMNDARRHRKMRVDGGAPAAARCGVSEVHDVRFQRLPVDEKHQRRGIFRTATDDMSSVSLSLREESDRLVNRVFQRGRRRWFGQELNHFDHLSADGSQVHPPIDSSVMNAGHAQLLQFGHDQTGRHT